MVRLIVFLASLAIFSSTVIAAGSSVRVILNDSTQLSGELLSVQLESFVIATKSWSSLNEGTGNVSGLRRIQVSDVRAIHIDGKTWTLLGAILGTASAVAIVAALKPFEEEPSDLGDVLSTSNPTFRTVASIGIVVGGGVVGYVIGKAISSPAQQFNHDELYKLKKLSRYPDEEPQILRDLPATRSAGLQE